MFPQLDQDDEDDDEDDLVEGSDNDDYSADEGRSEGATMKVSHLPVTPWTDLPEYVIEG
jgi:hypothetical protein